MNVENIVGLREAKGLTQQKLAEMLSVDRSTIAKWETGGASPRADKLPKLAEILGCEIGELFEREKENTAAAV